MDDYRTHLTTQATALIDALPGKVEAGVAFVETFAGAGSAAQSEAFAAALDLDTAALNAPLAGLVVQSRQLLSAQLDELALLDSWLSLSAPQIEDGNNFGVEVQMIALKVISTAQEKLVAELDGLGDYHSQRAAALEKLLPTLSEVSTTSKGTSQSKATGGKDGDEAKTSESGSTDTKTTASTPRRAPDAVAAVVCVDLKWSHKLKRAAATSLSAYATVGDMISKNMDKITDPKGTKNGGGGFNMY